MKFFRPLFCLTLLLVCGVARATITIEIDADYLTTSGNVAIADGQALFLVADETGAGFALPTAGNLSVGSSWGGSANNFVVGAFGVASNTTGTTGAIDMQKTLTLSSVPGWATGQHLGLYWFPTDTYSSLGTVINVSDGFGYFNFNSTGPDSSTWVTPTDPTTAPAFVFRSAFAQSSTPSTDIPTYGTIAAAVPEPSAFALLGGVVGLTAVTVRRRKASIAPKA